MRRVGVFWSFVAAEYVAMGLGFLFILGSYVTESEEVDIQANFYGGVVLIGIALVLGGCAWFSGRPYNPQNPHQQSDGELGLAICSGGVAFAPFVFAAFLAIAMETPAAALLAIVILLVPLGLVLEKLLRARRAGKASPKVVWVGSIVLVALASVCAAFGISQSVEFSGEEYGYDFKPWKASEDDGPPPLATASDAQLAREDHWLDKLYLTAKALQQQGIDASRDGDDLNAEEINAKMTAKARQIGAPKDVRIDSAVRPSGDAMATVIRDGKEKFVIATFGTGAILTFSACTGELRCGPEFGGGYGYSGRSTDWKPEDAYGRSEPMRARWHYQGRPTTHLPGTFADLIVLAENK